MSSEAKQFILGASCPNEYLDGFDYFVVEISPEMAQALLDRIKLFKDVQRHDRQAYELYFWEYSGDYFGGDPGEHDASSEPSWTECSQLVVSENEVFWTAIPKHTDIYVTTDSIKAADLAEVAGSLR